MVKQWIHLPIEAVKTKIDSVQNVKNYNEEWVGDLTQATTGYINTSTFSKLGVHVRI